MGQGAHVIIAGSNDKKIKEEKGDYHCVLHHAWYIPYVY